MNLLSVVPSTLRTHFAAHRLGGRTLRRATSVLSLNAARLLLFPVALRGGQCCAHHGNRRKGMSGSFPGLAMWPTEDNPTVAPEGRFTLDSPQRFQAASVSRRPKRGIIGREARTFLGRIQERKRGVYVLSR